MEKKGTVAVVRVSIEGSVKKIDHRLDVVV